MSADFWTGLAVIPAITGVSLAVIAVRWFVVYRIQRLKSANTRGRIALSARLFASKRAYFWSTPRMAVAVTLGAHWPTQDRAEGALLDEFAPTGEETR